MSSDAVLTERDKQLLDVIDEDIDTAETPEEFERIARRLREEIRDLKAKHRQYDRKFAEIDEQFRMLEHAKNTGLDDDQPPLYYYSQMPPEEREDELTTSELIAVTIHERWSDLAWTLGGGRNFAGDSAEQRIGVDTRTKANAKHNPSKLKHRLKTTMDRDLRSQEVYRALKKLAKLSGGREYTKDQGSRVEIIGGIYRYEERSTVDGQAMRRVLWRDDNDD